MGNHKRKIKQRFFETNAGKNEDKEEDEEDEAEFIRRNNLSYYLADTKRFD
jgi:hypothetical protein